MEHSALVATAQNINKHAIIIIVAFVTLAVAGLIQSRSSIARVSNKLIRASTNAGNPKILYFLHIHNSGGTSFCQKMYATNLYETVQPKNCWTTNGNVWMGHLDSSNLLKMDTDQMPKSHVPFAFPKTNDSLPLRMVDKPSRGGVLDNGVGCCGETIKQQQDFAKRTVGFRMS